MIFSSINVVSELLWCAHISKTILLCYRICFLFSENLNLHDLFKKFISKILTA